MLLSLEWVQSFEYSPWLIWESETNFVREFERVGSVTLVDDWFNEELEKSTKKDPT